MTDFLFDKNASINCCKDCTAETGRSINCHSTCVKYLEQREKRLQNQKARAENAKKMEPLVYMEKQKKTQDFSKKKAKTHRKFKKFFLTCYIILIYNIIYYNI